MMIKNATLAKNDEGEWALDNTYYWPSNGSVNFIAYTSSDAITYDSDTNKLSYTLPDRVEDQKDLLLATTEALSSGEVDLSFQHICSQLTFTLADDLPNGVIQEIKLSGIKYKGEYDIDEGTWKLNDDTKAFTLDTLGQETVENTAGKLNASKTLMLLPQDISNVELKLTISYYTSETNATATSITYTVTSGQKWQSIIDSTTLQKGRKYTIVISQSSSTPVENTGETKETTIELSEETSTDSGSADYQEFDSFYFTKEYTFKLKDTTKKWKIVSTADWLTFTKEMGKYQAYGFWVDSEKGSTTVEGTASDATADHKITVYAYCTENEGDQRDATVTLIEDGLFTEFEYMRQQALYKSSSSATFYTARYGYATPCVWGFYNDWGSMVFTCENEQSVYDQISTNKSYIVKDDTNKTITINFGQLNDVVYTKALYGMISTKNLYFHTDNSNTNATENSSYGSDGKGLQLMLQTAFALLEKSDSHTGDINTFINCAVVRAVQYNKFSLKSLYGVDVPNLEVSDMAWYLPGISEITSNKLESGKVYWTATGSKSDGTLYGQTFNTSGTQSTSERSSTNYVRAVRSL
jgi:hypothetical protein